MHYCNGTEPADIKGESNMKSKMKKQKPKLTVREGIVGYLVYTSVCAFIVTGLGAAYVFASVDSFLQKKQGR